MGLFSKGKKADKAVGKLDEKNTDKASATGSKTDAKSDKDKKPGSTAPAKGKDAKSKQTKAPPKKRELGTFEEKVTKLFCPTIKIVSPRHAREHHLQKELRKIVLYIVFLFFLTIWTISMVYPSMFYINTIMKQALLDTSFKTAAGTDITFHKIHTAAEFWAFLNGTFLDCYFYTFLYQNFTFPITTERPFRRAAKIKRQTVTNIKTDQKLSSKARVDELIFENRLLGVPRIRQLKVRNDTCTIGYFFSNITKCYGEFSQQYEDREPFGPGTETAWIFTPAQNTSSVSYEGYFATYHGGGFYTDLNAEKEKTQNIITELMNNLWITRGTRCVFIDLTIYNPNVNLFCVIKLIFEFPRSGGVVPSHHFQALKLIRYVTIGDYFLMACELLTFFYLIYYTVKMAMEIRETRKKYFTHFWNYIEMIIIGFGYACFITAIVRQIIVDNSLEVNLYLVNEYANFEYAAKIQVIFNGIIAGLVFFAYLKLFRFLSVSTTMGQLNNTLSRCSNDLLTFGFVFLIIFIAYSIFGYLLFCNQIPGFSGFGVTMFTLTRTILGEFHYGDIELANPTLAPFYYLSYIFLVFFVMLNMFLAIINDTYSDVKNEISKRKNEMQMWDILKRGLKNILKKWGCTKLLNRPKIKNSLEEEHNATIETIRDALKRCGFSDLEIEMFFARYNIDPTAEVEEADVSKVTADLEDKKKREVMKREVKFEDFFAQQERLAQVDKNIADIDAKIDDLLKKLDILESITKSVRDKQ